MFRLTIVLPSLCWVWMYAEPAKPLRTATPAGIVHEIERDAESTADACIAAVGVDVPTAEFTDTPITGESETLYRIHRITAYCDEGTTASGVPSGVGQCAAPADIPFGARVYIPKLDRTFIVTDRTARRFRQNTVDIFIPDQQTCLQFGRHYLECEITVPADAADRNVANLVSN